MAKVPGQRRAGSFGGDGHRSNRAAFRRSGGSVKPPSKSCALLLFVLTVGTLTPLVAASALAIKHLS